MTDRTKYYKGSTDGKRPLRADPLRDAKPDYDLIVIGSGLAGLTAANVLGRSGHRVALLEQHVEVAPGLLVVVAEVDEPVIDADEPDGEAEADQCQDDDDQQQAQACEDYHGPAKVFRP